jgi:hypothetical protein
MVVGEQGSVLIKIGLRSVQGFTGTDHLRDPEKSLDGNYNSELLPGR